MSRYDENLCKKCGIEEYDGEDEMCLVCRSSYYDHLYEKVKDGIQLNLPTKHI